MTKLFKRLAARLGVFLLSLRQPLTGYGLYFVFKFGTEQQAQKYLDEATSARARVVLVPVITNARGEPEDVTGSGPRDGYAN